MRDLSERGDSPRNDSILRHFRNDLLVRNCRGKRTRRRSPFPLLEARGQDKFHGRGEEKFGDMELTTGLGDRQQENRKILGAMIDEEAIWRKEDGES